MKYEVPEEGVIVAPMTKVEPAATLTESLENDVAAYCKERDDAYRALRLMVSINPLTNEERAFLQQQHALAKKVVKSWR